ncbi:hypothetical protein [Streptomyces luteolus]|uniref:Uncharacterized protein n=1 Tax=Streptomyces luteolus TaxID=3043615 RepID=A0ABT6SQV8_9ACTN|nr:hypothetical protein [Streptomyces sp. B-S-A12]MDI3417989.1 hypothetical protein [Streptomyces sp. B-S-A12]
MGRSFKWHAGIAAGCSVVLLALALLTFLPIPLVLPESKWFVAGIAAVLFLLFGAAMFRGLLAGGLDKSETRRLFRQLPNKVQWALGALLAVGFGLGVLTFIASPGRGSPEVVDGRYYVLVSTFSERARVEVSPSEYEKLRVESQRDVLAVPGTLFAGAALFTLIAGEARRERVATAALSGSVRPGGSTGPEMDWSYKGP